MKGIVVGDVLHSQALDHLVRVLVLAYASDGNAQAVVEVAVGDGDVRAVSLEGYAVVSVVHGPVVEVDTRGSNCVGPVSVRLRRGGLVFGKFFVDALAWRFCE